MSPGTDGPKFIFRQSRSQDPARLSIRSHLSCWIHLEWFASFIENRSQKIKVGPFYSDTCYVTCEVPQGPPCHHCCLTFASQANNKRCELFKIGRDLFQPRKCLPPIPSSTQLCTNLHETFINKKDIIRAPLKDLYDIIQKDTPPGSIPPFFSFRLPTKNEILQVMTNLKPYLYPNEVCPAWLLKKNAVAVAAEICVIINLSLATGVVPFKLKQAIITPLLKKLGFGHTVPSNFRPIVVAFFGYNTGTNRI